jgi:hypothetical protein
MLMKLTSLSQALNFSHLLGRERPINVSANVRADEDGDENDDAMRGKKSRAKSKSRADDDTREDGDGNETDRKGKSSRAEEDGHDEEEEDERPDGRKSKKAKSKARAEDREEEDEEDGEKAHARGVHAGMRAERERCREIFASEAASGRADVAAHLAFNTNMSAGEAIGTLEALAVSGDRGTHVSLSQRMEGVRTPNPGAGDIAPPDMSTPRGLATAMTSLYDGVTGRTKQ